MISTLRVYRLSSVCSDIKYIPRDKSAVFIIEDEVVLIRAPPREKSDISVTFDADLDVICEDEGFGYKSKSSWLYV